MTGNTVPTVPPGVLTPDQIEAVSGAGDCTTQQYIEILGQLKGAYETLIDFTSYVIERVAK